MKTHLVWNLLVFYICFGNTEFSNAQQCPPIGTPQERREDYANQIGMQYPAELDPYDPELGELLHIGIALHVITDNSGGHGVDQQELDSGLL
jgi:hypothetical protein